MFIKHYLYSLKDFTMNKSLSFWSLLFPFLLATMFYVSFGHLVDGGNNTLEPVKTAVVIEEETEAASYFQEMLLTLADKDHNILMVTETDLDTAKKLLQDKKVEGILQVSNTVTLTVTKSGINQTILKSITDGYLHRMALIENIAQTNPDKIPEVITALSDEVSYLKEISFSDSSATGSAQYFYALIAMTCLYGSFFGLTLGTRLQANLSALAMRRSVVPTRKMRIFICDFLAVFTIDATILLLLFAYLILGLKIDFGNHVILMLLTAFMGSLFGISLGTFIATSSTRTFDFKISISLAISTVLSFLAGLMVNQMPNIIEKSAPIINRLNPALLISNSFYCLTFYDNYQVYTRNMVTLAVYVVIFCTASILFLRRKKYASL